MFFLDTLVQRWTRVSSSNRSEKFGVVRLLRCWTFNIEATLQPQIFAKCTVCTGLQWTTWATYGLLLCLTLLDRWPVPSKGFDDFPIKSDCHFLIHYDSSRLVTSNSFFFPSNFTSLPFSQVYDHLCSTPCIFYTYSSTAIAMQFFLVECWENFFHCLQCKGSRDFKPWPEGALQDLKKFTT